MRWVAALLFSFAVGASAQTLPEPRVVRINERVHVLLGPIQHANPQNQGYMINSTVIVGEKGVILVDSGASADVGRHIAAAVRRITDKPVTHLVNTHHHGDHYLGNAAFTGAMIISSEECRRLVRETGAEWQNIIERDVGHSLPGTKPLPAQLTFRAGKTEVRMQGVRLVFWVPAGSHTEGDMMVLLPDDKVLVGGDVLVNGIVPTLQDGSLKNWIRTLSEIEAVDASHFVPGHGDLMKRENVAAMKAAMARFQIQVKQAFKSGKREYEIRPALDLSAWDKLERSYVIGRNINRAWLEIESDSFDEE